MKPSQKLCRKLLLYGSFGHPIFLVASVVLRVQDLHVVFDPRDIEIKRFRLYKPGRIHVTKIKFNVHDTSLVYEVLEKPTQ